MLDLIYTFLFSEDCPSTLEEWKETEKLKNPWNSCCTEDYPCGEGYGDCDHDAHCLDGLVCGKDNCKSLPGPKYSFSSWMDCCESKYDIIGNIVQAFKLLNPIPHGDGFTVADRAKFLFQNQYLHY